MNGEEIFKNHTSRNDEICTMKTRVLSSPSFKREEEESKEDESKEALLLLNELEEKYSKALRSGCRKKRSELLFLRSDENDERRRLSGGFAGREEEGTTKAFEEEEEEEEEEEGFFELDAKALFAPSPVSSSVALLRSDGKVSSSDDEENEENENKKKKKLLLVRREKIRETNVQLDEDVRNVRDLLERLKTNHYYRSEKATSFSETTLLGRESGELFDEKQRRDDSEEDFYEEEVKEESKEEDRTRRRQLLLLQNHLLLPTNAEIAGVTATTQTPRTKKTEDWSVPAEDLVLLSSFRDDDENNENFVSSNPTAESLRAAGIIF